MSALKRAEVEDLIDLSLNKTINKHVKGSVLQVLFAYEPPPIPPLSLFIP